MRDQYRLLQRADPSLRHLDLVVWFLDSLPRAL